MEFNFTPGCDLPIFDTHAHYNDPRFDEIDGGRDTVLTSLFSGNVKHIVNIGCCIESSRDCIAIAEKYPQMYATVGVHPGEVKEGENIDAAITELRLMLAHEKVKALGEIGLDYYYGNESKDLQKLWFRRQLELASELKVPVVIHDRDAHGDVMDILREYPDVKGVFHSFSASGEIARQLTNKGWYISFSGVVTFKNATRLAEIVPTVPLDRVMLETDAPYLAPVPYRGKLNHSGLIEYTAARAAELYGIDVTEMCRIAYDNAMRFFKI